MTNFIMKHTRGAFSALMLLSLCVSVSLGACNGEGEGETDGDSPGDCPSDEVFFDESVWQPIASMSCYGCHNAEGTAKATRMILQGPDEDGAVEYNMELMATMAMEQVDGMSLILAKPTGMHPDGHGGGVAAGLVVLILRHLRDPLAQRVALRHQLLAGIVLVGERRDIGRRDIFRRVGAGRQKGGGDHRSK